MEETAAPPIRSVAPPIHSGATWRRMKPPQFSIHRHGTNKMGGVPPNFEAAVQKQAFLCLAYTNLEFLDLLVYYLHNPHQVVLGKCQQFISDVYAPLSQPEHRVGVLESCTTSSRHLTFCVPLPFQHDMFQQIRPRPLHPRSIVRKQKALLAGIYSFRIQGFFY